MDFASLVRSRLASLGVGQKDLALAAQVTESYVSQLLTRRKPPPCRERTDIYPRMEAFLRLSTGELGRLAECERAEELKRRLGQPPPPLFHEFRELVLRKCRADRRAEVRAIFDAQPFGVLERLITQKLLSVVQRVAREELNNDDWMRLAARVGGRSHEEMRVVVLEFLDTDVFHVSNANCVNFLDPLLESWCIDLDSFRIEITLNAQLVPHSQRVFSFVEDSEHAAGDGLEDFLADRELSHGVTEEEVLCLRRQELGGKRPNKLYYYRALQNLRDPLHFGAD